MAVGTGYTVTAKLQTLGTCTCSSGVLSVSGGTCTSLPYMDTWSFDMAIGQIPTTSFGDYLEQIVDGFPTVTGTLSGGLDLSNSVQLGLANAMSCGSSRTPRIFRIVNGGKTMTFKGRITSIQQGSSVGSKSTFSISLQATSLPKSC